MVKLGAQRYDHLSRLVLCLCCAMLLVFPLCAAAKKKLPAHPIDLNTATLKQLEELPGVGPSTAQAILNFREKSGPFKSVNDLLVIPRISKRKLDKMRPYITIGLAAKNR